MVLGCRVRGAAPSPPLRRRLERAIALYRAGAAPLLVLSGGGAGPVPEAEIMARLARGAGVPEAALVIEAGSRNTVENARHCARLLRPRGVRRVLLVSDRAHLPRATLLFRLAGFRVAGAGVPPSSRLWEAGALLHEIAALPLSLVRVLISRR